MDVNPPSVGYLFFYLELLCEWRSRGVFIMVLKIWFSVVFYCFPYVEMKR